MMPVTAEPITTSTDWLAQLFDGCQGWLTLFSLDRDDGTQRTDWAPADNIAALVDAADQRSPTCCVWFGVATRKERLDGGRRGGAADCLHIPALWVDIDVEGPNHKGGHPLPPSIEAAYQLIVNFPVAATAVVRSGGGLQGWWLLHEPLAADDNTSELLRAWGATWVELARRRSWHLDNVFDIARIMRLPGTWNRKQPANPAAVTAKAIWERRYDPSDFEPYLLEPPTPPDPTPARIPYIGPERPGDAFNALHSGGSLLLRAGFRPSRRTAGEEHWTRPGKDPKDGTSATVYADGHTTLWSDTILSQWPAVELRRPYDPFGLFCVLFWGGDFTAASEELADKGYGTSAKAADDLSWIPNQSAEDANPAEEQHDPQLERAIRQERLRRQARRIVDNEQKGSTSTVVIPPAEPDPDIQQLLAEPEPDYRWLVPGLLERADRVIFTGPEGGGKSTLLRQLSVQIAAGIHPFTLDDIDPGKVLYVDLENSRRHALRQFEPLLFQTGGTLLRNMLIPVIRPDGIDLLTETDEQWLTQRVEANEPDIVIIGPLYKLALGDPNSEEAARHVAFILDRLRATYDVALLMEAHQPHKSNGSRPERPYGASLWMRWPEFGVALTEGGFLKHWRGARDQRDWPAVLRRGGEWPWLPASVAEAKFASLMQACRDAGEILSTRDLEKITGIPKSTVQRALDANRDQWQQLEDSLRMEGNQ